MEENKKNQLLNVEQLIELRNEYMAEPYSLHVIMNPSKDKIMIEMVHWLQGVHPHIFAAMTLFKRSEELREVDTASASKVEFAGNGKLLYYLAMDKVYPAYISADSTGCSRDAKRVYDAFEKLDYVESKSIFSDFWVIEVLDDKYPIINRMYRFQFPRIKYLDDPIKISLNKD